MTPTSRGLDVLDETSMRGRLTPRHSQHWFRRAEVASFNLAGVARATMRNASRQLQSSRIAMNAVIARYSPTSQRVATGPNLNSRAGSQEAGCFGLMSDGGAGAGEGSGSAGGSAISMGELVGVAGRVAVIALLRSLATGMGGGTLGTPPVTGWVSR